MISDESEEICPNVSLTCNEFALDIYKALSSASEDNVILSPLSVHIISSLLSHGARGKTLTEMKDGLNLNELKSLLNSLNDLEGVKLSLANAFFKQQHSELLPNLLDVCKNVFDCTVSNVDFAQPVNSAEKINDWVDKVTKNKIKNAVSPHDFDSYTRLVFINAIYFEGNWLNQFEIEQTKHEKFYVTRSNFKSVPTMFKKSNYPHGELFDWNARFVEIPYVNENFSMIIIYPHDKEGLRSLEAKFSWDYLKTIKRVHYQIELYLPKFEIEATIDLGPALNKLEFQEMLTDNVNSSALPSVPDLYVIKAFQKIHIKVNEGGSEAAGATVAVAGSGLSYIEVFRVNRPFMIVIRYKPSDIPLFIGSVKNIPPSSPVHSSELWKSYL